jgi:RNA polymerase sigma-70 factor (ECF subfamily)
MGDSGELLHLARWPRVRVSREEHAAWAAARGALNVAAERRDELALACACSRGDREALEAFDATFARDIESAVARFGDATFVGEVRQAVRALLFVAEGGVAPRIGEYRGRGELVRFIRAVATRTALTLLSAEGRRANVLGDDALVELAAPGDDPELAAIKERYRDEFRHAFAAAIASLEEQSRALLRLYYLDGLGLAALGQMFGWSVPTASRRLTAARGAALEATRQVMSDRLGLSPSELDSVLRLIQSQLPVDGLTADVDEG